MKSVMQRLPERELMDGVEEARNYAGSKYPEVVGGAVERMLEVVRNADEPLRLIDLGCGPGTIPLLIARARPAWRVTALDASKTMLRIAGVAIKMAGLHERVHTHLANAKQTDLPARSFDIVFCNNVLHHMPDPVPLWREMKRLAVAPRGFIFVRDLVRPDSEEIVREMVAQLAAGKPDSFREGYYDSLRSAFRAEEVREQLRVAQLFSLRVEEIAGRYLDVYGTVQ
jgi:ubiquinone/menaquinone biosynthesis C-methylase UbiE